MAYSHNIKLLNPGNAFNITFESETPILIVSNNSHVQISDIVVLTQGNVLSIYGVTQLQAVSGVGLTQHYTLFVNNTVQAQTSENVTLIQHYVLSIGNAAQGQFSDNVTITYNSGVETLTVQDSTHIQKIKVFPTTFLLDDFNRADENPINTNWDGPIYASGLGELSLLNNQLCAPVDGAYSSYWVTSFNQDQEVFITMSVADTTNGDYGILTRITTPGTNVHDYLLYFDMNAGLLSIWRHDSQSSVTKLEEIAQSYVDGYKFAFTSIGDVHTGYVDIGNGWQQVIQAVDNTYMNGGYLGVYMDTAVGKFDDFGGGNYTSNVVLSAHYAIVVNDSTQLQISDNVTLTQHQVLAVNSTTHVQTSDNVVLTQHQILIINNCTQTQTSDNVVLTQHHLLTIESATQSQTSDNIVLTQHHVLIINNTIQNHVALSTQWWLAGGLKPFETAVAYQPQLASNYTESKINIANPGVDNAVEGVSPDWDATNGWKFNPTGVEHDYLLTTKVLSVNYSGFIQFTNRTNTTTEVLFGIYSNQGRALELWQDEPADTINYGMGGTNYLNVSPRMVQGNLGISGKTAYRNGISDGTIPSGSAVFTNQKVPIAAFFIDNTLAGYYCKINVQAFVIYNITLTPAQAFALYEAMGVLGAKELTLTSHYSIIVNDATQIQTTENTILVQHQNIVVQDATQAQTSDNIVLTQHHILSINNATQQQFASSVTLVEHMIGSLIIQYPVQIQTSDTINLAQYYILLINNCTQTQTSDNINLIQHQLLVVQNTTQLQIADVSPYITIASDTFSRPDGALGYVESYPKFAWGGSTWSISSGSAINTPNSGSNIVINGSFENGEPPDNWSPYSVPTVYERSNAQYKDGSYSLHISGSALYCGTYQSPYTIGTWYKTIAWVYPTLGGTYLGVPDQAELIYYLNLNQWNRVVTVYKANYVYSRFYSLYTNDVYYDSITTGSLTQSEFFATLETANPNVSVEAGLTWGSFYQRNQMGLVLKADNTVNPQNFILATITEGGGNAWGNYYLQKVVNGTWTTLFSGQFMSKSMWYSAGAVLRATVRGNKVSLYYKNVFLGETTVNDTEIINNTIHGLFSTFEEDKIDNFYIKDFSGTLLLTEHYVLDVDDSAHTQTTDNIALVQYYVYELVINNTIQTQTINNIILIIHGVEYILEIDNATQSQKSDEIILVAYIPVYILIINNTIHLQTAQNAGVPIIFPLVFNLFRRYRINKEERVFYIKQNWR